jgi:benzoate membrane transport protein
MSEVASATGGTSARGWFSLTSAALTAVVVGFASTILLIMEAANAVGASPAEKASWAAALCIGQAITTLILSWRYKMPIITAWSTPGAALIATSAAGIDYRSAIGAFITAGLLMCVTALFKPVARAIEKIPASIAALGTPIE